MELLKKTCPKCRFVNRGDALFCQGCGNPLPAAAEDNEEHLLMLYIEKNTEHYHKAYERRKKGRRIGWNWPAFLIGGVWAIYRRMYKLGVILLAIQFGLSILLTGIATFLSLPDIARLAEAEEQLDAFLAQKETEDDFYFYYEQDEEKKQEYFNNLQLNTKLQAEIRELNGRISGRVISVALLGFVFSIVVALLADGWYLAFCHKKVEETALRFPEPELALSMESPCNTGGAVAAYFGARFLSGLSASLIGFIIGVLCL